MPFPGPGSGAHGGVTAGLRALQMELVTAGQSRSRQQSYSCILIRSSNRTRVFFCLMSRGGDQLRYTQTWPVQLRRLWTRGAFETVCRVKAAALNVGESVDEPRRREHRQGQGERD